MLWTAHVKMNVILLQLSSPEQESIRPAFKSTKSSILSPERMQILVIRAQGHLNTVQPILTDAFLLEVYDSV
jgi:hypothetical protein